MSLLIFVHQTDRVIVLTDTLATTKEGNPMAFWDKCFVYPHLKMVMAVTGVFEVAKQWNNFLNGSLVAKDIDMVDIHTPEQLQSIQRQLIKDFGDAPSSTVYHFGWSEEGQQYKRYIYRSTNNFESEPHSDGGFGIKPQPINERFEVPETIEAIIELAKKVRDEQRKLPRHEQVFFGGEIIATMLDRSGISIASVHTFDDNESDWDLMNQALDVA